MFHASDFGYSIQGQLPDGIEEHEGLEDTHGDLLRSESFVSKGERAWLRWVRECEAELGHDLDGNNSDAAKAAGTADGYSLDHAHDAFMDGLTPTAYAAEVREHKADLAREKSR